MSADYIRRMCDGSLFHAHGPAVA